MIGRTLAINLAGLGALLLSLAACSSGGEATSSSEGSLSPVFLQSPTVVSPGASPYYSNDDTIVVGGLCNSGYTVRLTDTIPQQVPCLNSQYSFEVSRFEDGLFPFSITQSHPEFGTSQESLFIWIRKSSVTAPTLIYPSFSPFPSGNSVLNLQGGCETGTTIEVSGDATGEALCDSSRFTIPLVSYDEGSLNLTITQTDQAGNSASTPLVWRHYPLRVSPPAPEVAAGTTIVLVPSGGSESYITALSANNSGSTYNTGTYTYVAGTMAGTTDVVQFVDSLGEIVNVNISVIPAAPDHFQFAAVSGDAQMGTIGETLPTPLRVEIVDRYSNPIPDIPLLFRVIGGDARITSTPSISSDANGGAEVTIRLGNQHYRNLVGVKPASGILPDLAGSGNDVITFNVFSRANNSKQLGTLASGANQPTVLIADDYTGNGQIDLGVLNASDPSVGFMQGIGNGLFETMNKVLPICSGPTDMVDADFNGDGLKDVAMVCSGANRITLLIKMADNSGFLPAQHIDVNPIEGLPVAIAQADFDGDGFIDIATASASGNSVSLRLGFGDGTFDTPTYFAVGSSPSSLSVTDLNNDTRPDLVVLNAADATAGFLYNNGLGGFNAHFSFPVGAGPADLVTGDFNNDGFGDVAVANNIDDNVSILINDQFGGFFGPDNYPVGSGPIGLATTDLDGDGNADLVVSNVGSASLSILTGFGNGTFFFYGNVATELSPGYVLASDINGDGNSDILVSTAGQNLVQIFIGQGNGDIGLEQSTESNPSVMRMASLNGDAYTDMVVLQKGTNTISIWSGNGLGTFTETFTINTAGSPADVAIDDFNGDGFLDLAVVHQDISSLRVYTGFGDGTFGGPDYYATALQPVAILSRDMNADGHKDLVVANAAANSVSVFPNLGTGLFDNRVNFPVGSQPTAMDIADFNGDHELDIAVANGVPGSVSILLSGGNFTFQPHYEVATGNGSSSVIAGFLNADSIVDLAVANETAGNISILIGQGNGSFTGPTDFFAGTPCRSLVALDYDGNNQTDLMVTHGASESITILFGSGNGLFNTTESLGLPHSADFIATGDVNSDGQVDFVTIDPNKPSAVIWLGD